MRISDWSSDVCSSDLAAKKGRASATAIVDKVRCQLLDQKLGDFSGVDIHCIGAEESYGPHARAAAAATREVVVKIVVQHANPKALKLFAREIAQAANGMAPGRSAESRVGKECGRTCRSRWSPGQ